MADDVNSYEKVPADGHATGNAVARGGAPLEESVADIRQNAHEQMPAWLPLREPNIHVGCDTVVTKMQMQNGYAHKHAAQ